MQEILSLLPQPRSRPNAIQLNFRELKLIGQVDRVYHQITVLSLNNNSIRSLAGVEQFYCLERLSLNSNYISDLQEFKRVSKSLKELEFKNNPTRPDCDVLMTMFPNLISLNGNQIKLKQDKPNEATLNLQEQFLMLRHKRRHMLKYGVMKAWRALCKQPYWLSSQSSTDSESSYETNKARLKFKTIVK